MFKRLIKYLFIPSILIGATLFATPYMIQLDAYQSILEKHLSQSIGRKVLIGSLSPQVMPLPALTATNISILGNADQPGEIFVEHMQATLDPLALLRGKIIISRIHLKGAGGNLAFINALISPKNSTEKETSNISTLNIHQISGENIMIRPHNEISLGPYRFSSQFRDNFGFKGMSLSRMDGTLQATLTPNQYNGYNLRATGTDWTIPTSPSFKFDKLSLQAVLHKGKAEITNIEINGYDGLLKTTGTLSWGKRWQYNGQLTSANIHMTPVLKHFGITTYSGNFHSALKIKLNGNDLSQLFLAPEAKGTYHITNGSVKDENNNILLSYDEFSADAHLTKGSLINDNNILKIAGGTIQGITHLRWKNHWNIKGWVVASDIDTEIFLSGFIEDKIASGTFYATGEFDLNENDYEGLLDRPYLTGEFKITDGRIYKADLEKATTTLTKEGSHGGETPFQHLTGKAIFVDNHIEVSNIDINSNSINANGNIKIDPQHGLSGEVTVALRKTASIISAPLKVSGTINNPSLRLTNDAIIGGVIGTSILGPGIGTAVGMKVGRVIKKIGSALGSGGPARADLIPVPR
ncbi:MAG: AsmA family protein [Gammaproteobacteria bacterium]|nr:AsmA family protein [Gammaproteobacteria bacterium]